MSLLIDRFDVFAKGFWLTLQLCAVAGLGALLLGALAAVLRISPLSPLRWVGTAYVTLVRNAPLTVVFFFATAVLPALGSSAEFLDIPGLNIVFQRLDFDLPYFRFAVLALAIYTGAFVCEALRSGVNAVSPGQAEAGRSLGLTFGQNLRHVVLPQSWSAAVVPLGSVLIAMIKNSALAGFFGLVGDLSNSAQNLISVEGENPIPVFIGIIAGFLVMTVPLGMLMDRIERRRAVAAR